MARPRLLWIDGLGGFMLATEFPLSLGSHQGQPPPDVPLLANVAHKHAYIEQDEDGFTLRRGDGAVEVHGKDTPRLVLSDGVTFVLGGVCQLQFIQPIVGGGTARLEVTAGGRIKDPVHAVLLMTHALTIANDASTGDLLAPGLETPVSIVRTKAGLAVRVASPDGAESEPLELLEPGKTLKLRELCMTLE